MPLAILIYILVSHKIGWGVEWYDWVLFGAVCALNLLGFLVQEVKKASALNEEGSHGVTSYFSDVNVDKKKDKK